MVPITIPAIAPPLKPPPVECEVIGRVLPLAVATGMKGTVVDTDCVVVDVETPPLVGLEYGEYEEYVLVTVGAGIAV